jgi:transcription-repair coupling factor (superfamily II helicase)
MNFYNSLLQRINNWSDKPNEKLQLFGTNPQQWSFLLKHLIENPDNNIKTNNYFLICPNLESAETLYETLKNNIVGYNVFTFSGLETSPYGGIYPSERNLFYRFRVLDTLTQNLNSKNIIICTYESYLLKVPPKSFFESNSLKVETSDIISPLELSKKLVEIGYNSTTSIEEPGTFVQKGEIFDIYPVSHPAIRLHYFDDMIEEIYAIDLDSQKTIRSKSFEKVHISPTPAIFSRSDFATQLRDNIAMPAPRFKEKFEERKRIFSYLRDGHLFENYPFYVPLFFKESNTICDYVDSNSTLNILLEAVETSQNSLSMIDIYREQFENESIDIDSNNLIPSPDNLYELNYEDQISRYPLLEVNELDFQTDLDVNFEFKIELSLEKAKSFINQNVNPTLKRPEYIKASLEFLKNEFRSDGNIIFATHNENSLKEIKYLIKILDFDSKIQERIFFRKFKLNEGFYYRTEKTIVISEADIFSFKQTKTKHQTKKDVDLFAEQLATLKSGDYIIHNEHGIGEYLGLESLDVGDSKTDYIVITYKGNDKVYVPVYKMNNIQKHAESTANISVDSLRTNKFSNLKSKAKNSAKKLAFDLLKLQAERQSQQAYAFSEPDHEYKEFELAFPFQETPDQERAVTDVLNSMQKPVPMDHLVCGDVGFGKTEIAMRAAYKAILDGKQVAVLVPTTVLAMQHFNTFKKRMKDFAVSIESLSRFKTAKQVKEIKENLIDGKIDIVVGTHKLLSETIKYKDLGLVIVDEEQRFGVGHKEKLKLMKASVDFLTLTATPIPRTLQLAFLGLRDLTLIKTAPPKRQSIKTYLIKEDDRTIQSAIRKELSRGGQVFIVHNKVQDIESFTAHIKELVPEAQIVFAHGQLSEKELQSRMESFYKGIYQILISTTIIESGIDIPNANTMIVDRADTYGLSQLHQLRGRIGRSDKKAYAYFVIPHHKKLTDVAEKRLRALQTYADMGSGFNIANCDLEIRGAGDILGGSQSGHVEAVGLELYMELLKEAIQELRGEKKIIKKDIEINTPFASYIPNNYISNSSERLKNYKLLSNCSDEDSLNDLKESLYDVYGAHPEELNNLFTLLEVRIALSHCGLKSVHVAGKTIILNFEKSLLEENKELRDIVVDTFISRPKIYQFTPDFKVIYGHKTQVNPTDLVEFSKGIAEKIVPYK